MLPPLRSAERPSRACETDEPTVTKTGNDPATDSYGRVILKSSLRVLEPIERQTKLTVVK